MESKKIKVNGMVANLSLLEQALKDEQGTGYENTPQLSIEEIERMIENGEINSKNKKDILDRVYEISPDSPEENEELWERCLKAKRAIRKI